MVSLLMLWTLPNTLVGLTIGGVGCAFGGKARLNGRTVEFYGGLVQWLLQKMPQGKHVLAVTVGNTILGQSLASLNIARDHELVHVAQFERWGPLMLPVYTLASCYVWMKGKRFYRDNPFEVEAYAVDGDPWKRAVHKKGKKRSKKK